MKNQQEIIKKLEEIENQLRDTLIKIKLENTESQFDFTTNSKLSTLTDNISSLVSKIENIVYQKEV